MEGECYLFSPGLLPNGTLCIFQENNYNTYLLMCHSTLNSHTDCYFHTSVGLEELSKSAQADSFQ